MKFVCMKCEQYMAFQKVEAPEQGRLGITFGCASCGARFSMVTNPGETQLVSSLGVSLGGRTEPLAPLEMTRNTLKSDPAPDTASMADYLNARMGAKSGSTAAAPPADAAAAATGASTGTGQGCPFSSMVREMGLVGDANTNGAIDPVWSDSARTQMDRLPPSVRHVVTKSVEDYARKHGFPTITAEVIQASKRGADGLEWSPEASARLQNIPDFVRPMARKEIERLARARGATTVTAEVMDEAKGVFGQMGH